MKLTRARQAGFTLLEMLVVMLIVSLISTILFQALDQVYKLQSRFGLQLAQSQQGTMYTDWFRQVVQGLQTDYSDSQDIFQGGETEFTGVTTSPLSAAYGTPATVTLSLEYDGHAGMTRLLYVADQQKTTLSSWAGRKDQRFTYIDAAGESHDSWPPPLGIWPQLPNMILLQTQEGSEPKLIAAVPRGSYEPKDKPFDVIGTPF
jgi:general secretion pathway protein J